MKKVLLFSILLLLGLIGSQWLPAYIGPAYAKVGDLVRILTMAGLSFIMIRVGYEFDINKSNLRQYGWDYFVAFTAASFPWVFVTLYFVLVLLPPEIWGNLAAWQETLLAGRFAAPTSAGVLFSMLAAAYFFLHEVRIPVTWPWVMAYAGGITGLSEVVYQGSKLIDVSVTIHIEVILSALLLGCVMAYPKANAGESLVQGVSHNGHDTIDTPQERHVATIVAAVFMVLVGLSMPMIPSGDSETWAGVMTEQIEPTLHGAGAPTAEPAAAKVGAAQQIGRVTAVQPPMSWAQIVMHVLIITIISNIGKMFPAFCYRREAHWRESLALSIGMWPRGEVGAGVLVISLSYGIGGPIVTVAMLSLALNLLLTGVFIYIVKQLTGSLPAYGQRTPSESTA